MLAAAIAILLTILIYICNSFGRIAGGYISAATLNDNIRKNGGIYVKKAAVIYGDIKSDIIEEYFGGWSADTMVAIGSCGKSIVCAAAGELAKQGKLSLTDLITKYYTAPDYKDITLADIMAHRSGLVEYVVGTESYNSLVNNLPADPIKYRDEWTKRRLLVKPDYAPGSIAKYNNDNMSIIAAVIEKVTGKDYREVIDELVAKPIGIKFEWGYHPAVVGNIIVGWGVEPQSVPATEKNWKITPHSEPSGDVFMSIGNFVKYIKAHAQTFAGGGPYNPELYVPIENKALGWNAKDDTLYHTGGAFGHSSKIIITKAGKYALGVQNILHSDDFGLFTYVDGKIFGK